MTSPHDDAGAYALDALDPLQRTAFERHLQECAACREEVTGHLEVAAALAASVTEPPPPSLRGAVMDRVAVTPQDRTVVPLGAGTGRISRRPVWVAAAAVAVIALVGLAGLAGLAGVARAPGPEVAVDPEAVALLAAPDARVVPLTGTAGGRANFVHSPSQGRGVLVAYELEPLAEDRVYELWVVSGDSLEAAGLLTPAEDGIALHVAEGVGDGTGVAVTVEPEGGVAQPTGPVVLSGSFDDAVSWTAPPGPPG